MSLRSRVPDRVMRVVTADGPVEIHGPDIAICAWARRDPDGTWTVEVLERADDRETIDVARARDERVRG